MAAVDAAPILVAAVVVSGLEAGSAVDGMIEVENRVVEIAGIGVDGLAEALLAREDVAMLGAVPLEANDAQVSASSLVVSPVVFTATVGLVVKVTVLEEVSSAVEDSLLVVVLDELGIGVDVLVQEVVPTVEDLVADRYDDEVVGKPAQVSKVVALAVVLGGGGVGANVAETDVVVGGPIEHVALPPVTVALRRSTRGEGELLPKAHVALGV